MSSVPAPGTAQAGTEIYVQRMRILQAKLRQINTFQPTIFPDGEFLPQQYIDVGWGGKESETVALFGNLLPLEEITRLGKPDYVFETAPNVYYTVIAFDADYHEEGGGEDGLPYLLWHRTNVCGDVQFASGKDLVRWQSPHPITPGGKPHRIFFAVFSQAKLFPESSRVPISKNQIEGRKNFKMKEFMKEFDLKHVIGVNCCCVEYDKESVEKTVSELRDVVGLDPSGKKILYEIHNGQRKDF
eukprot:PhF_6_TR19735/c0_g1_i1/m.28802